MNTSRFSLTFSCPMYSPNVRGRSGFSTSASSGTYSGAITRFSKSKSSSLSNVMAIVHLLYEKRAPIPLRARRISSSVGSAESSLATACAASDCV